MGCSLSQLALSKLAQPLAVVLKTSWPSATNHLYPLKPAINTCATSCWNNVLYDRSFDYLWNWRVDSKIVGALDVHEGLNRGKGAVTYPRNPDRLSFHYSRKEVRHDLINFGNNRLPKGTTKKHMKLVASQIREICQMSCQESRSPFSARPRSDTPGVREFPFANVS